MRKKEKYLILGLFVLLVPIIILQCTNQNLDCEECKGDEETFAMQKLPVVLENFRIAGVELPSGTVAEYLSPKKVQFTYPEGYQLISMNSSGEYVMNDESEYECSCTGSGCNVVAMPGEKEGEWDVGCSSCTSACTGQWVEDDDLQIDQNSVFINTRDDISFIQETTTCTKGVDASAFFEIPELNQKIKEFLKKNELTLWDGKSDDHIVVPMTIFGTPVSLRLNSSQNVELNKKIVSKISNAENFVALSGDDTPTCNCNSGSSGCEYEPITVKLCGWCPEKTIGHQCIAGDCESCAMTFPEVEEG